MIKEFSVRLYELCEDGSIEPIFGSDIEYFGGSCPNVGDTIVKRVGSDNERKFFSVQRRIFIDDSDGEPGWVALLRRIEPSPLMDAIAQEWTDETQFWRDIDAKEKKEHKDSTQDSLRQLLSDAKPKRSPSSN